MAQCDMAEFNGSTFSGNRALQRGGGMAALASYLPSFRDTLFDSNFAAEGRCAM